MKRIKDTLGIKYEKYADIYNIDDAKLGKLFKYLMWQYGRDVILRDLPEISRKRIIKYSSELTYEVEGLTNDYAFEKAFDSLNQQISKSHRSWKNLRKRLDDAARAAGKNVPEDDEDDYDYEELIEECKNEEEQKEIQPIVMNVPDEQTEETYKPDFWFDGDNICFEQSAVNKIIAAGLKTDTVASYLEEFKSKYDCPITISIDDVIAEMGIDPEEIEEEK